MKRSALFLATPGPDRVRLGVVEFTAPPFVRTSLRFAYRMARRRFDPIDARILVVTALTAGVGADAVLPRTSTPTVPARPVLRLVAGE